MRSKTNIKGHPLHPILVSFPIVFFIATFFSDIILFISRNAFFGKMAAYLEFAGIAGALLAALPGIIDYFHTVPPKSSAKKRATRHGLLNVCMLLIFSAALVLRTYGNIHILFILLMEGAGLSLMTVAAWMGGTLVNRNQIGVDHRYAEAGKWKEEKIKISGPDRVEIKEPEKLNINQMKLLHINGKRIVIGRTESGLVAFDDYCTHRGASLADGVMICGTVQCPWHGSQFNLSDGSVKAGPAHQKIKIYKIERDVDKFFLHFR